MSTVEQTEQAAPSANSALVAPKTKAELTAMSRLAGVAIRAVALARFGDWRPGAIALVEKYRKVAFDVGTTKGYDEAVKARAEVRAPRYLAQNVAKDSKTELAAVSKGVGAELEEIIAILADTEKHINDQIVAEDTRRADAKAEKARIEAERTAAHQANLDRIAGYVVEAQGRNAESLQRGIDALTEAVVTLDHKAWEEFADRALEAYGSAISSLRSLHAAAKLTEDQAAELERQRMENERIAEAAAEARAEADRKIKELEAARQQLERDLAEMRAQAAAKDAPAPTPTPPPEAAPAPAPVAVSAPAPAAPAAQPYSAKRAAPAPAPAEAPKPDPLAGYDDEPAATVFTTSNTISSSQVKHQMSLTQEDIARVCHTVNAAYCAALGDFSQPTWELAPEWQRESARMGVDLHVMSDFGPEASHIGWMSQKAADGWKLGPVKDPELKEHPCMVAFADLPREQQAKEFIFRAVVHALRDGLLAF